MVLSALVAVAVAQYDISPPRQNGGGGTKPVYGPPQKEFEQQEQQQSESYTPQLFRHVYVHAAPDEPADEQARTIRVPGGDKHVNIIFVKTPSQSSQSQTEVILPEQDEHKNLVYVLLKKNEAENNIKIRRPEAQRPQKPEVYFIRYKGQEEEQNGGGYSQGPQQISQNRQPQQISQNRQPQQISQHRQPQQQNHQPQPAPVRSNGNGNGYSEAGVYSPSIAPGPIRSQSDVPSSGYGVPN